MTFRSRFDNAWLADTTIDLAPSACHRPFHTKKIYSIHYKNLQELPESMRADAVSSMVYEAKARIRDPVYGCAGAINQLQKELRDLQTELAATQADLAIIRCQQQQLNDSMSFPDQSNLGSPWESYWN